MSDLAAFGEDSDLLQLATMLEEVGTVTPTQLILHAGLDYDRFEALVTYSGVLHDATKWWIADAILFGEQAYGADVHQAAELAGRSEGTIENWVSTAAKVVPSRRRGRPLSFTHHVLVSKLPPRQQTRFLDKAVKERMGTRQLAQAVREWQDVEESPEPASPFTPNPKQVIEAARSLLANAEDAGENVIVRREDAVQLRAAVEGG